MCGFLDIRNPNNCSSRGRVSLQTVVARRVDGLVTPCLLPFQPFQSHLHALPWYLDPSPRNLLLHMFLAESLEPSSTLCLRCRPASSIEVNHRQSKIVACFLHGGTPTLHAATLSLLRWLMCMAEPYSQGLLLCDDCVYFPSQEGKSTTNIGLRSTAVGTCFMPWTILDCF